MLGFDKPLEGKLTLKSTQDINSKYYIRINVSDRAGVLAKITKVFEENNISVETMLQRPASANSANLLISTHMALEKDIQNMIKSIESLEFVNLTPVMIRIV